MTGRNALQEGVNTKNNRFWVFSGNGLEIAMGNYPNASFIHKFGNAPDFDQADNIVTIWDGANDATVAQMTYQYSSTADIDSISSSDNADTQNIKLYGLDSNWQEVEQIITLTGQTRTALSTNLLRIYRMCNCSNTNLAGYVYCYVNTAITAGVPNDTTKIRSIISNGNNQTLMAVYSVATGKTGYLSSYYVATAGATKSSQYIVDIFIRPFGEVFQLKHRLSISDIASSHVQHFFNVPEVIEEKSDVEIRCAATEVGAAACSISAGFDITLINN